ncbi:hypothetical protein [Idiomarina piscisalsi]|uniref:Uncharacterized protein n=1 Tax=Idiomarina piscisalsi TaxID=1096243 RepID=A0A432YRL6_9GAMM|nr:hypothetical protein [Idiomarina piscisalsi]RUO64303.1 hypothetical protein CWI73_09105 [Idiomarina piscisalsi]
MTHPFSNVAFEHIVYIGAGQGEELKQLAQSLTAKHWSVIDGDENNTQQLTEVSESLQEQGVSIDVQQKVVATNAEKVTWYNYNLAEFNGIHKASELTALFPGLKLLNTESVTPTPVEEILAQLNITEGDNLLIIDIPAQGVALAKAVSESSYKCTFNFMCITSQTDKLFENSNSTAELKSWLLRNGYHTRNEEVDDPDFPKMHFALSHTEWKQANELKQAQEQIEKANAERDEVKAELEHANEAMHKRTEWARNLQAKLEQAVAEKGKLAERAEKAEAQIEDLQASVKEVSEERDEAAANASNASKELEQLKQQFNEKSEQADSAQTKVEKLEQVVSQANEEKQKQTEWAHSLQTQLEEAVAEKGKLAERAEKAEAQIEDLQASVKEVSEERDEAAANASNASKELEQLKQQFNEKSEQADSAQTKVEKLEQAVNQANEEKQKQTEWAHSLQTQLEEAVAEKGKLAERAEKAEAQIEDLQASVKEVSEERDEAAANASNASKELEQLKQQFNEKSEQADSAQTKVEKLEQVVSQANEEKQKQTEWAHSLQTQLEEAVAEKGKLAARLKQAEARNHEVEKELGNEIAQVKEEVEKLQSEVDRTNSELDVANEENKKQREWASGLDQKLNEKSEQVNTAEAKIEELKQAQTRAQRFKNENDKLQKKLEAAEKYNDQLAKLNERMDYMFEQQRLQLEQATNALGRHITQTSSQQVTELKARLSLERTFGSNLIELNDNSSNLSEVTAVTLTQQLEENSYDLIIEFGAGKSTEFLANAIINNHSPSPQLENKSANSDFDTSDFDLPQQVLSFEYEKKQFNTVKKRIEQNGLQNLVDLKYAPLVPTEHNSELFYDCARTLTNVANLFDGREAKVLIVVNPTSEHNRPHYDSTLAAVLNSLSALQLDIFLNENLATKALQQDWNQLLQHRGLPSEEKRSNGAYLLRINP